MAIVKSHDLIGVFFTVLTTSFKNLHVDIFFAAFTRSSVRHITSTRYYSYTLFPVTEQTDDIFSDAICRLTFRTSDCYEY